MSTSKAYLALSVFLLTAAIVTTAILIAAAIYQPPRERPPLRESAIWAPYEYLPDDNTATIDATRGCLVLSDGRDFICDGAAATPSEPTLPPA